MDEATKKKLQHDLVRLGDMMGDGLHHEPGGQWITAAYKRVAKALGHGLPRRNRAPQINAAMATFLETTPCPECGGKLKQSRAGSKRCVCEGCGKKYQCK